MVTAGVMVAVVIGNKLYSCMFCGGICGVGSGSSGDCFCGDSYLPRPPPLLQLPQTQSKPPPSQPASSPPSQHSIHLTMALLVNVVIVALVGFRWWWW